MEQDEQESSGAVLLDVTQDHYKYTQPGTYFYLSLCDIGFFFNFSDFSGSTK